MVNNACITSPHFQRYIQAPVLHRKVSDFSTKVPQARHIGQSRADQSDTKVKHPPWPFLQHAQCWTEGQQQSSTNPTELMTQSLRKKSTSPNTVLMQHHPIYLKVPAFSEQIQQNRQHLQKPQRSPDKKCQPPHPARLARARWEVGAVRKKKIKKVSLVSPSRIAAWFSLNLHQDVK